MTIAGLFNKRPEQPTRIAAMTDTEPTILADWPGRCMFGSHNSFPRGGTPVRTVLFKPRRPRFTGRDPCAGQHGSCEAL